MHCTNCLKHATYEIFFKHSSTSFVACCEQRFDSKFREFPYEIPRMDVNNRRMIFSLSCCPSGMLPIVFETCPSRTFMKSWQSIPGPKTPGAIRYAENGLQVGERRVRVFESEGGGEGYFCEPSRYFFHIGRRCFSSPRK